MNNAVIPTNQGLRKTNNTYLYLVCLVAALGGFLFGFDTAVISGALPFLTNDFKFDPFMEGWFVSSALLGCILGVIVSGKLSDSIGRKKVMILSAGLFFVAAVGSMLAPDLFWLIVFRIIGGLGIGVASMICPLYISEIAPPAYRGRMVALYQLAITVGIVAAYLSNAWLANMSAGADMKGFLQYIFVEDIWRAMIGIGLVPSILFWLGLFFVPESPRWLIKKGRLREGEEILSKINDGQVESIVTDTDQNESGSYKELFTPKLRKALLLGIMLPLFSQLSGINAIIYYGPSILHDAGIDLSDSFLGQIIFGLANLVFTFIAIWKVDEWGRRPLYLYGTAGATLSLLI
ncbi:MAG: MFS transporter, partial [Cytophagaceae bacterium]